MHSYQLLVRGVNQDSGGSFIESLGGQPNRSRLFCTLVASGISDPVPGAPSVVATLDVVTSKDPTSGQVLAVEASEATGVVLEDVWNQSPLRLTFDDVMNPATLVNPATGQSATIRMYIDPDGYTLGSADRIELQGDFLISIDEAKLVTEVTFTPSGGWSSADTGELPRAVVVVLLDTIADLGAHPLTSAGELVFVPEFVPFDAVTIPEGGEQFVSETFLDADNTGALWGGGALLRGVSGGSGRLGPLVVAQGTSGVVLNTDAQSFTGVGILAEGPAAFPPSFETPSVVVTGGIFEFSSLDISAGAELRFEGSQPARLIVRGAAFVRSSGTIDSSGRAAPSELGTGSGHDSSLLLGGDGGAGGAVLLQAPEVELAAASNRIRVDCGLGLVRVESAAQLDPLEVVARVSPFDSTPGSLSGGAASSAILSVGTLAVELGGPEGRSGAQSCWMAPSGNFFLLEFAADDWSDPLAPELGWDVDVISSLPDTARFSLRDANDPKNPFGLSPEAMLGTDLGGISPGALVIRFQGIHRTRVITDPCNIDLTDAEGDVEGDVDPAELNSYWDQALPAQPDLAAKRRSSMIRYQVIFDHGAALGGLVAGVTNLRIDAQPD